MGSLPRRERDVRLDLVRVLATFLVVSVHFFLNSGYYDQPMVGGQMLAMTLARMAFMTCVPLFLLLTGYLCRNKALTGRYYLGLVRILLTYGLCALVCLEVRRARGDGLGWKEAIRGLLDFSAAPYGWYIEMYVGLFLLIPFFNILWRALETRTRRRALVATLLAVTVLPALTNLGGSVLPDWWVNLYPLTYYFLGAYFAEYPLRVRWRWGLPALLATVAAEGAAVYWLNRGQTFAWRDFSDWNGPGVALSACLLFLLLLRLPLDRAPGWLKWLLGKGSELSLGVYLLSWCFDTALYPILLRRVPEMGDRPVWFFAIVPAVYLCATLAAQGVEWARRAITWCLNKICPRANLR